MILFLQEVYYKYNSLIYNNEWFICLYLVTSVTLNMKKKPWITIQFPENTFKACSYLCYNHCRKFVLPKDHFDLIVNKEDFNHPRPITHKPDNSYEFKFLTETEINQLSMKNIVNIKKTFKNVIYYNPISGKFIMMIYLINLELEI